MDARTDIRKPSERSDEANKGGCANLREQVQEDTGERGCGYWPTPTTAEADKIPNCANYGQVGLSNHPRIRGLPDREKATKSRGGEKMKGTVASAEKSLTNSPKNRKAPSVRGRGSIQEEKILRSDVHGDGADEGNSRIESLDMENQEVEGNSLRNVQHGETPSDSPCRQRQDEQPPFEPNDIVHFLSHEMALDEWESKVEKTVGLHHLRKAIEGI